MANPEGGREVKFFNGKNEFTDVPETSNYLCTMQSELDRLKETILSLQMTIYASEVENMELTQKLRSIPNGGREKVSPDKEKLERKMKELMQENDELHTQLVDSVQEADKLKKMYDLRVLEENNKVIGLETTLNQLKINHTITQRALMEAQSSIRTLREEKKALANNASQPRMWDEQKKRFEEKITFLQGNLGEAQSTIRTLREEKKSLADNASEPRMWDEQKKRFEEKITFLQDNLGEAQSTIRTLRLEKKNIADKTSQFHMWDEQKKDFKKKINYLKDKCDRKDIEIIQLNTTIGDFVLKHEALKEQFAAAQSNIPAAATKDDPKSSAKLDKLTQMNDTLQIQVDALLFEVELLREKQASDYSIIQEKDTEIIKLQRQVNEQKNLLKDPEDKSFQENLMREHKSQIVTLKTYYDGIVENVKKEKESLMIQIQELSQEMERIKKDEVHSVAFYEGKLNQYQKTIEMHEAQIKVLQEENSSLKAAKELSHAEAIEFQGFRTLIPEYCDKLMELIRGILGDAVKGCVVVKHKDLQLLLNDFTGLKACLDKSEIELQASEEFRELLQKEIDEIQEKHAEEVKTIKTEKKTTDKEIMAKAQIEEKAIQVEQLMDQLTIDDAIVLKEELQLYKSLCDDLNEEVLSLQAVSDEGIADAASLRELVREKSAVIENLEIQRGLLNDEVESHIMAAQLQATEREAIIQDTKIMEKMHDAKIKDLMEANGKLTSERNCFEKKLSVLNEKDKEIYVLKDCIEMKDKSIDKLNNVLREKNVEIIELRLKKNERVAERDTSFSPIAVQKEIRKCIRQNIYDGNRKY